MLKWALIFFLVSLVAGFFGFTGVAAGAASIAKILFFVFLLVAAAIVDRSGHRRQGDLLSAERRKELLYETHHCSGTTGNHARRM